jgi:hypothetical protein
MLGQTNQSFAMADLDYRIDRIFNDFPSSPRPFHLKWPVGLLSWNRRRPRYPSAPRPAPHHATSIGW